MATREIYDCAESEEYVLKCIPQTDAIRALHFEITDYSEENLNNLLVSLNSGEKSAIIQQYNEWRLWRETMSPVLAPIVDVRWESNGLPILCYPRFAPLIDEGEIWNHTVEELYILLGRRAHLLEIDSEELFDFLDEARDFCVEYDLCEADVFTNPSNIGWHRLFGLRIIDYGLSNKDLVKQ